MLITRRNRILLQQETWMYSSMNSFESVNKKSLHLIDTRFHLNSATNWWIIMNAYRRRILKIPPENNGNPGRLMQSFSEFRQNRVHVRRNTGGQTEMTISYSNNYNKNYTVHTHSFVLLINPGGLIGRC